LRSRRGEGLRRELFELLATSKERAGRWRREAHRHVLEGQVPVVLATDDVLGGEPVFEGTRTDLLGDYPALGREDVELAKMYVAMGRPPGRPRKRPKFVRG
jgi:hypothetical protein